MELRCGRGVSEGKDTFIEVSVCSSRDFERVWFGNQVRAAEQIITDEDTAGGTLVERVHVWSSGVVQVSISYTGKNLY